MHVLPKGFHRIRHYGLFANGNRAANIAQRPRVARRAVPLRKNPRRAGPQRSTNRACCGRAPRTRWSQAWENRRTGSSSALLQLHKQVRRPIRFWIGWPWVISARLRLRWSSPRRSHQRPSGALITILGDMATLQYGSTAIERAPQCTRGKECGMARYSPLRSSPALGHRGQTLRPSPGLAKPLWYPTGATHD